METLLTLEQREWETLIQENSYWHDTLVSGYKSRTYWLVSTSAPFPVPLALDASFLTGAHRHSQALSAV